MARNKKSKRPNLPQETLERARAELRGEVFETSNGEAVETTPVRPVAKSKVAAAPQLAAKPRRASTVGRRVPTVEELLTDYRYVLRDLRNLAILAASLFVAIVVISFVLAHI